MSGPFRVSRASKRDWGSGRGRSAEPAGGRRVRRASAPRRSGTRSSGGAASSVRHRPTAQAGPRARLDSAYVDLVQLHEPLERWEWQLEKLHALQLAGKALAVGLCNATHGQLERALILAPLATYQAPYSLFDRDVEERDLPLCRARGLAFLAYRPLAAGLLTGKYEAPPQFADGDHRQRIYRSEERRVGKECRSRWSPYH